ncbi:MAG: hypothetical protein WA979_05340 [Pacificimonas sp.]
MTFQFLFAATAVAAMAAPALADGGYEDTKVMVSPATLDTDGDGRMDGWDRDGDGKADAWDTDGDDAPDRYDEDRDGEPDED